MKRELEFKYIVLRNGADYCSLDPVSNTMPTISMQDSGEIKTSLAGTFYDPGGKVDWLTDEIQPIMVINGVEHKLGVYLPGTVEYAEDNASETVSIEAYDRCWRVQTRCAETLRYFAQGLNYLDVVVSLLTKAPEKEITDVFDELKATK